MTLKVVGAGLGRTGTNSLKLALEQLTGEPCYHMIEVFGHLDEHVPIWHAAMRGEPVDWAALLDGYGAAVDWPAAACWRELAEAYPDAPVLLSHRDSESWWRSAQSTIFVQFGPDGNPGEHRDWYEMAHDMLRLTFTPDFLDEQAARAAFDAHNAEVRATIAPHRLVEWSPGDGWEPLAKMLGVAEPDEPYPHVNSTEEFRRNAGYDA